MKSIGKIKKFSCILLAVLLLFSASPAAYADNVSQIIGDNNTVVFVDVTDDYAWASEAISYFSEQGIVSGVGDGRFAPEEMVTREQFAKMLVLTFNAPLTSPAEPTFSDVPKDKWSYPYIEVSKDFLTGFVNPFGGKMTFRPEEAATREDIAVALIRIMGLTDKDVKNPNYAQYVFKDAANISPGLLKYVSAAAELGLINGFEDGTFRPTQSVTRAESVVLLNRATKQAVSSATGELEVSASMIAGDNPAEVTLSIKAEEGTKVTVDGQAVRMDSMGNGYVGGMFLYSFAEEGTKTFIIEAAKGAKRKSLEMVANYRVGAPVLTITQAPANSELSTATIKGTVTDKNDSNPVVTINGHDVDAYYGQFEETVSLVEGENKFTIVATNSLGKSTTVEKTITFGVDAPVLTITQAPAYSELSTATIKGTVKDKNDNNPVVTINGRDADAYYGQFEKTVSLDEGENKFTIVATNKLGKSTTVEKTITFGVDAPVLTITQAPSTSESSTATIKGTVKDKNDNNPVVTVNGMDADAYYGQFEKTVSLDEGDNVFTIVATNKLGKSTTVERTITYHVSAPEITLTNYPEVTNQKNITLQGFIKSNDRNVKMYINDQEVSVSGNGSFSHGVSLTEGENTFVFRAVNSYGKSTSQVKTVTYAEIVPPVLSVDPVPGTATTDSITISGTVDDKLDPDVAVYVNDEKVASSAGGWSAVVDLEEGSNDIIIVASNKFGKSATVVKEVTFIPPANEEPEQQETE